MRALFALALFVRLVFFFAGCKKEDIAKFDYPSGYHKISMEETAGLKVFTNRGEIKLF